MNATANTTPATIGNLYEKALARARKFGIRICGRGVRKSDGAPIVAVSSASQPGRWHVVVILPDRLWCDCPARGICIHRAIVREELLRAWTAERDRVERVETERLRQALAALSAYHCRLDEALRAARPPLREAPGDAPTVSQQEAAHLLQRGISARIYRPDVARLDGAADVSPRLLDDVAPVTIWKR